jgi:cellulose biosynthesis protein BcsQ
MNTVLIGSSKGGTGKSVIALNLIAAEPFHKL